MPIKHTLDPLRPGDSRKFSRSYGKVWRHSEQLEAINAFKVKFIRKMEKLLCPVGQKGKVAIFWIHQDLFESPENLQAVTVRFCDTSNTFWQPKCIQSKFWPENRKKPAQKLGQVAILWIRYDLVTIKKIYRKLWQGLVTLRTFSGGLNAFKVKYGLKTEKSPCILLAKKLGQVAISWIH